MTTMSIACVRAAPLRRACTAGIAAASTATTTSVFGKLLW
jgi:hypothetical protein